VNSPLVDWAPAVVALVGYGLVRAGVVVWVLRRSGLPESALGWSGAVSGLAAAAQAVAGAVLLVVARWRRPLVAWMVAVLGVCTAVVDALLWVVLGSRAEAAGFAWQVVLAMVFAVGALIVSGSGFEWLRRKPDGYDLRRINYVLLRGAAAALVVAAVAGATTLMVDRPAAMDRLLNLVGVGALASAVSLSGVWWLVASEQRSQRREAALAEMYRRINDAQDSPDQ
jgi:hypothetical protein